MAVALEDAIKFAGWQHPALGCMAKFDVPAPLVFELLKIYLEI